MKKTLSLLTISVLNTLPAFAADAEQVEVENVEKKYWAQGKESELGVVQNRTYSKAKKFDLGIFVGTAFSDPFLSIAPVGGSIGYHFSEQFGVDLIGMYYFVGPSSALTTFQDTRGATANTNYPLNYFGAEGSGSFLYGKLSFLSSSIIYYDLHLLAGMGRTLTQSGAYFTGSLGLGQRFYINKVCSFRFDYRLMLFHENILEKEIPSRLGEVVGSRMNYQHSVMIGVDFLVNIFGEKEAKESQ